MNKLQEQSLQAKDARYLTDIIDEGNAKTQEMIGELLSRSNQSDAKTPMLSFGGVALNRNFYNLFITVAKNSVAVISQSQKTAL